MSKKVRREIRELSSNEWDDVVKAMWIMKTTSDADGKRKFGRFFVSYDTMVAKHMTAAMDPRGDQAHFGPILGPYHRAWLIQLENSLLSIDKGIAALPYWDKALDTDPHSDSSKNIFSDEYFGSYVGEAPDYSIVDGKFAYWKIRRDGQKWKNSFGYMRHPLNPNKSPYVTRNGGSICGYPLDIGDPIWWDKCLEVGDSILDWTACVDANVHGMAHSSIAGSWRREGQESDSLDCAQWYGYISPPASAIQTTGNYAFGSFVNPYTLGCFKCPECTLDQDQNSCMCISQDKCGPLWTKLRSSNSFLRGSTFADTTNFSTLINSSVIQVLGGKIFLSIALFAELITNICVNDQKKID